MLERKGDEKTLNNTLDVQKKNFRLEDYSKWVDTDEIRENALKLKGLRILNVNSVARGGGVSAILSKLVPAFNSLGITAHWYVPEVEDASFFSVTKKQHNMFQGQETGKLTMEEKKLYRDVQERIIEEIGNRIRDYDVIIIHDTQFLGLVDARIDGSGIWIYRCHIDTSNPNRDVLDFFKGMIDRFDAAVYHRREFVLPDSPRPFVIPPSIDPLEEKNDPDAVNGEMIREAIESFGLNPKRPVLLQVGRFDPAKGYERVCELFKQLKPDYSDIQLLLTGAGAKDDPQFEPYLEKIRKLVEGIPNTAVEAMPFDVLKLNAVQQGATVVYALSTREGFGLVVSEASIKEKPVIVSDAGGLPEQVVDGRTGFVVSTLKEAVEKTALLLDNPRLRDEMGREGRKYILSRFITPIHLNNYLKMLGKLL